MTETSHSEQGLMHQYAKYRTYDVSIAIGDVVENGKQEDGDIPVTNSAVAGILSKHRGKLLHDQYYLE